MNLNETTVSSTAKRSYKNDKRTGRADVRKDARDIKRVAKDMLKAFSVGATTFNDATLNAGNFSISKLNTLADALHYGITGNLSGGVDHVAVRFANAITTSIDVAVARAVLTEIAKTDVNDIKQDLLNVAGGESDISSLYGA